MGGNWIQETRRSSGSLPMDDGWSWGSWRLEIGCLGLRQSCFYTKKQHCQAQSSAVSNGNSMKEIIVPTMQMGDIKINVYAQRIREKNPQR